MSCPVFLNKRLHDAHLANTQLLQLLCAMDSIAFD